MTSLNMVVMVIKEEPMRVCLLIERMNSCSAGQERQGSSLCLCGSDDRGAVLYTGPDGVDDYKIRVLNQSYVGHGTMSPEGTADVQYLCRASKETPHPAPKSARVGEVGWGVPKLTDYSLLKSKNQIQLKEFRQAAEDRHTHLYQNPYYPPDQEITRKHSLKHVSTGDEKSSSKSTL